MPQKPQKIKIPEISKLPRQTGVYIFYGKKGKILYIGKANNIKERVKNHFKTPNFKGDIFIKEINRIGFIKTDSEIEALLLEAKLIKKHRPKFNVLWKDDKNYFFAGITKEDFPRIFLTHQINKSKVKSPKFKIDYIGPFVDGKALKQTLKVLRRVFPYRTNCRPFQGKACLWYQLGLCPGACAVSKKDLSQFPDSGKKLKKESQKAATSILKIIEGKKNQLLISLKKEMGQSAKLQEYELAAKIRNQITAMKRVFENAKVLNFFEKTADDNWQSIEKTLREILKIKKPIERIECYDISNIQGKMAAGSMVVFEKGKPQKKKYRKFKIKMAGEPNDTAMLKEVLLRRFNHPEWPLAEVILIDGGKGQLNVALKLKIQNLKLNSVKVMALAKRNNELFIEGKKKPLLLKNLPQSVSDLILRLRDEAHRFAITYHKKLREKEMFAN